MSTLPIDLGYRLEARAQSPDPSQPSAGELLAFAQRTPTGDWAVVHRDGRQVSVTTKVEAAVSLLRLVDGQPSDAMPWEVLPDGSVMFHGFSESPLTDELVRALRVLGCETRDQAVAVLDASPVELTDRERAYVLDQYGSVPVHGHMPDLAIAAAAVGLTAVAAADRIGQHPCQVCGVELEWARHTDRDQYGWREVAR